MTRTDCHRPSVLVSSDYEYICSKNHQTLYIGWNPLQSFMEHIQTTKGKFAAINGGNCDICGVAMQSYCIYYHKKTNQYIKVGEICASKIDANVFDRLRTEEKSLLVRAGKGKAVKLLAEMGIDVEEVSNLVSEANNYILAKKPIELINSVLATIVKSGKVSDKQVSFLHNLIEQIKAAGEKEEQLKKDAVNIPEWPEGKIGRLEVTGIIQFVKYDASWDTHKAILQLTDGRKVSFNLPSKLDNPLDTKGKQVSVSLEIKNAYVPDKITDKFTFAYGSRPTKFKLID